VVIFTDYKGMTVAELSELRRLLAETVLNTTSSRTPSPALHPRIPLCLQQGMCSRALWQSLSDMVTSSGCKEGHRVHEEERKTQAAGGVIEGRMVDGDEVRAIAALPSRKVLMSILAGTLQAPLGKLAVALSATVSSFVHAMNGLKEKRSAAE